MMADEEELPLRHKLPACSASLKQVGDIETKRELIQLRATLQVQITLGYAAEGRRQS